MSITVNSYSATNGLLIIDSTVTSPADYKIHTFYVLCNGHYADEVVPFWDRISPAYQQVMTTANRRSYIDLSIFPNGSLTFSVRCKHAKTIAPIGSILEDTAVDVTVENSSFVTLLTPLPTTYPMGAIAATVAATITPATATGATTPVVATATRYVTAQVKPASATGLATAIQAASAGQTAAVLAAASAIGSCVPVAANAVRYVAAEVASANASGRASPVIATVTTTQDLTQVAALKGAGGVSYPMYIKGGSTAGFRFQ